jgi:hypothetical protein
MSFVRRTDLSQYLICTSTVYYRAYSSRICARIINSLCPIVHIMARLVTFLALLSHASGQTQSTDNSNILKVNGWYPCSIDTFKPSSDDVGLMAELKISSLSQLIYSGSISANVIASMKSVECAVYMVPLCYDDTICKQKGSTSKVFVKRLVAQQRSSSTKALWLLQGGAGSSSVRSTFTEASSTWDTTHRY